MQPQTKKHFYKGSSKPINSPVQARTQPICGANANRQQQHQHQHQHIAISTPRQRYSAIQPAAMFPPLHPSVVMSQFNAAAYAARPPNLQYPGHFYPPVYYPYYVPQLPQQQQQQQQQQMGTVAVNQTVLPFAVTTSQPVGLSPLQQTPAQFVAMPGNSSILGVTHTTSTVSSVSVPPARTTFATTALAANSGMALPQVGATAPQIKAKLRSHALQIIHPVTNKNILQDLHNDKEISFPATTTSQTQIVEHMAVKSSRSSTEIVTRNREIVSISKGSYKDAAQQAEQTTTAPAMTHDVCVEIIPALLDKLESNSAPDPQQLTEKISRKGLEQLEDFKGECNELPTAMEVKRSMANLADIEQETVTLSEPHSPKLGLTVPQTKLETENDKADSVMDGPSEASVESRSVDETCDDAKPYSETSSVVEDQANLEDFQTEQDVSKNSTPTSDTEDINYNEIRETPATGRDCKQYSRKQLMQLRHSKQSCLQPELKNSSIIASQNLMPAFAARCSPRNMPMMLPPARDSGNGLMKYQNNYIKQNSRANRSNNNGPGPAIAHNSGHHQQHYNRHKDKPLIYLNLSLNQEVKLNEADQAWKPRLLATESGEAQLNMQTEIEELLRRVRGILNKLTPEKFEPLVEQIIKLKIDNMDKMEAVMNLVFEKAIDEPNFSVSYAKLCHRLISEVEARDDRMESSTKSNLAYFRKALLDKTEREFTHHVTKINAKEEKLQPIREKYDNCQDANEKIELEALLNEEERKIRRRSGGTVRFIGELFKISILSGRIINSCIEALLKDPDNEDMLECLCKLLTTVGQKFEQTNMRPKVNRNYSLNSVIQRMKNIAAKSVTSKISSRVRFMLLDVIDLRTNKWQSTRNEAPKTMQQIEQEIKNNSQTSPGHTGALTNTPQDTKKILKTEQSLGGKRLERARGGQIEASHTQRGPKRCEFTAANKTNKWQLQTGKPTTQAVDTSKLVGLANVDMNNKKMGGLSLFQWQKFSSHNTTNGANSFAALSSTEANKSVKFQNTERERNRGGCGHNKAALERETGERKEMLRSQRTLRVQKSQHQHKNQDEMSTNTLNRSIEPCSPALRAVFKEPNNNELKLIKSVVNEMLESTTVDKATVSCIQRLPSDLRCPLIYYILTDYLHLANVKTPSRRHLSHLVAYLIDNNYLSLEHFHLAYRHFAQIASDLIVDIPELWLYIFEFTGPLMVRNLITVKDLWNSQLKESGPVTFSQKFLKSLLLYSVREIGPSFTRNMWQKHCLKWSEFMAETDVDNFITSNRFEFIENDHKPVNIMANFKEPPERLHKRVTLHIQQLLKENCRTDLIIDYIQGNIAQVTKEFVHNLTTTLTRFALKGLDSYSLDVGKFQQVCTPILRYYLNGHKDLELECLNAVQLLMQNLELPKDLWLNIGAELSNGHVIGPETFRTWQTTKQQ